MIIENLLKTPNELLILLIFSLEHQSFSLTIILDFNALLYDTVQT